MQSLQGFQFLLWVHTGAILLGSGSLCRTPALSLSWAQGGYHIRTPASLHSLCMISLFHPCHSARDPCAQAPPHETMCVPQPLLPPSVKSPWHPPSWPPPLPSFHARRDLITQKLAQRRIVCFYGISARAVVNLGLLLQPSGHCAAVGGLSPL